MSALVWVTSVIAGLLLMLISAAVWAVVRRRMGPMRAVVSAGARRLKGRVDPASVDSRVPALLADIDGRLLRAGGWPADGEDAKPALPPYLELCTPVEGVTSPLVAIRRAAAPKLNPLLGNTVPRHPVVELPGSGLSICGNHAAPWAGRIFDRHPTWVMLEIDSRMLRVLTSDPQAERFNATALENAVRTFATAVPEILVAAGLTDSSARGNR